MQFQLLTPDYLAATVALEAQLQMGPMPESQFVKAMNSQQAWVCIENDQLLGYLAGSSVLDEASVLCVGVVASARRRGIAKQLLAMAEAHWEAQGIVSIFLEVRASNQSAIAAYDQAGYVQIGERPNYYPLPEGGREHAVIMACQLSM